MLCLWFSDCSRLSCRSLRRTSKRFSAYRFRQETYYPQISLRQKGRLFCFLLKKKPHNNNLLFFLSTQNNNTHSLFTLAQKPQLIVFPALFCLQLRDFSLKRIFFRKSLVFNFFHLDTRKPKQVENTMWHRPNKTSFSLNCDTGTIAQLCQETTLLFSAFVKKSYTDGKPTTEKIPSDNDNNAVNDNDGDTCCATSDKAASSWRPRAWDSADCCWSWRLL